MFSQVIVGIPGVKPLEVAVEFANSFHSHFTGGVFFVNASNRHFIAAAQERIEMVSATFQ